MDENQITIVDENGNEHLCDIITTFESDRFGNKMYVVYSPIGEYDEDGDPIYDAAIVEPDEDDEEGGRLAPIENEEEWEMVQELFNTLMDEEEL
ncbi:DUF1292 domain-containing protein [Ectobacillus antri]|uniref:UPF0473 protein P6P90_04105 n=1 Tax=Ectobacillus antri TaxID=2486280 RepID=A0ABT6H1K4_9BACI|nr:MULTISPECIES: DUF1292 domain-containing protein [Ectobacillus]MDG4655424.1 DUF1292 domain-containing protein [Ectobacillus antri]MDG5753182.1 DUF1292 domain-containing protein [Ectobacillus antri]UOY94504.1 DUF1292 domain-containing protein [Ectobacillus sp. JY-23]